jgi:putative transposase
VPRPLRAQFPGAIYHVVSRGVLRLPIFLDAGDRPLFLVLLEDAIDRYRWCCHAYCLMGNHFHLLLETPEPNLAAGMQVLNSRYAQLFNRRHGRRGHVFEARYGDVLVVRETQLVSTARYIVLNPVRAAICRNAEDWPWSSFAATTGNASAPPWLTTERLLAEFDSDPTRARAAYARFVAAGAAELLAERRSHARAARLMRDPALAG